MRGVPALVAVALALVGATAPARGQELHGASDVFVTSGVAVAWGILRAPAEEETQVVIRVVLDAATPAHLRVDAVDPFTGARRPVFPGAPVAGSVDIRSPRATFADFPRREIRLYRTAEDWRADTPALTIYYLGVPDTTPEFLSESALLAHLAATLAKARR